MNHFPLQIAYLCECGLVGNNAIRCACGNAHGLLNLGSVLNREPISGEAAKVLHLMEEMMEEVFA